jgi:6-phosphogluconolactonase
VFTSQESGSLICAHSAKNADVVLAQVLSPLKVGVGTSAVAVDPSGRFAYVSNNGASATDPPTVRTYTIDSSTGALTLVNGSAVTTGASPVAIGIEPSGRFAYVTSASSLNVFGYAINAITGVLKELGDSPYTAAVAPNAIAFDPSGKFAYVTNGTSGSVTVFTISAGTGSLTQIVGGDFIVGTGPSSITVSPSGQFAFVGYQTSSSIPVVGVSAFAINGNTGALTSAAGSPFTLDITQPFLSIHPSGLFLYGAGYTSNSVAAATVKSAGALSRIAGSPFTALSLPGAISADPSGKFVYAASAVASSNNIFAFRIDPTTGALGPVSGSPFTFDGMGPVSIAVWGTPQ